MKQENYKKIRDYEGILKLRGGDVIKVKDYGLIVFTGISETGRYVFLGRNSDVEVEELHVRREGLSLTRGGLLKIAGYYYEHHIIGKSLGNIFSSRDELLKKLKM